MKYLSDNFRNKIYIVTLSVSMIWEKMVGVQEVIHIRKIIQIV